MSKIITDDLIVLENRNTGGKSLLRITGRFSSRIYYSQESTNGKLDLSGSDYLQVRELDYYKVIRCDTIESAEGIISQIEPVTEIGEELELIN